jgi:tetratricopeptide (TPR) repeat protein
LYSTHLNVRRAALTTADKAQITGAHMRAADFWANRRDFATAARHRLRSGSPGDALVLVRDNRESIIAAGRLNDLEALAQELLESDLASADAPYALHLILASCSHIRGNYADACKHWSFALHNPPDAVATAMLYNRRGDSYRLASEYGRAESDYRQAEAVTISSSAVAYRRELGRARLGIAKLDRLKGDYGQARIHYAAAHDAFEECFDEPGLIETSFGIGEVSRLAADWPAARQAYSESLSKARKAANAEREAYALWGLGEVSRLAGDYPTAEEAHRRGLEGCVKVCDIRSEGWALLGLAETYRAKDALDNARIAYHQAADRFTRTKSATEIAHATLGWC